MNWPRLPRGTNEVTMEPTPRLKRIMQLASDEARRHGATSVGTEHVLLAILRDNRGTAAAVLQQAGLDVEKARTLLGGPGARKDDGDMPPAPAGSPAPFQERR
jgi:ATP-dependent Clp protease ATP-binding subunit ClpC